MSELKVRVKLPPRRPASPQVSDSESDGEAAGGEAAAPAAAAPAEAAAPVEPAKNGEEDAALRVNSIRAVVARRKPHDKFTPVPPVHKAGGPPGEVDLDAWDKLAALADQAPQAEPVGGVLQALWKEAVTQHRAQLTRAQKRRDLEQKMKEDRVREIQALREQAMEEETRRRREEEEAKEREEKERNEAREKARRERERMAQTIDMDAQQQIMEDAGGEDEDEDEDMGGF